MATTTKAIQLNMRDQVASAISNRTIWVGRIISALPALFLLIDGIMKLVKPRVVVDATVQLGYPESVIRRHRHRAARLHDSLLDSTYSSARRDPFDRLSRRCGRDARAHQWSIIQHYPSRDPRCDALGRSLSARPARPVPRID